EGGQRTARAEQTGASRSPWGRGALPPAATRAGWSGAVRLAAAAARRTATSRCELPGGASDIGGGDVGRMPVQAAAGAVISHRGPWVSMRGSFLDVAQRDPGIPRRR